MKHERTRSCKEVCGRREFMMRVRSRETRKQPWFCGVGRLPPFIEADVESSDLSRMSEGVDL